MSISHLLETFAETDPRMDLGSSLDDKRADHELTVFENGYKAGWEDCSKAAQSAGTDLTEDFAQNLRELAFTYQEAFSSVIRSFEPLVCHLVETTLPDLANQSLGQQIAAEVAKVAKTHTGCALLVTCHPSKHAMLRAALPQDINLALKLSADDRFEPGQVSLRFAGVEREIDIDGFTSRTRNLIQTYFEDLKRESNHD